MVTATEIDLEQLEAESAGGGTAVQRLVVITTEPQKFADGRTSDQPMLHVAWEPLSFEQRFDRAAYPFRTDDFSHDWVNIYTRAGKPMGGQMPVGRIKKAFNDLGFVLTPAGQRDLAGRIFVTTRTFDEYVMKGADGEPLLDEAGKPKVKRNWFTLPTEALEEYTPPSDRRLVSYPTGGARGAGLVKAIVNDAQVTALRAALNGLTEDDYFDAVVGTPEINCDPFLAELSEPSRLTERLVALGGEIIKGRIYFA